MRKVTKSDLRPVLRERFRIRVKKSGRTHITDTLLRRKLAVAPSDARGAVAAINAFTLA